MSTGARTAPVASVDADSRVVGPLAVIAAAGLWGTVGPAQVLADSAVDPGTLGVARLLVGGAALALLSPWPTAWRAVLTRTTARWILLAAAATGVYQVTFMHAVDQLGAALGTSIALGVAPIATGVCARWWSGERLSPAWVAGTALAVLGCAVLLNPWGSAPAVSGVCVALVSGICYGVYTVAAKKFLDQGVPAVPVTAATLLLAGVALSPLLALHTEHLVEKSTLALLAWTGLAGTALAYAAFVRGVHRTTAATAGTLSLAEPLLAAALGVLVLHEGLGASTLAGCALLLAGLAFVAVLNSCRRQPQPPARRRGDWP